MGRDASCRGALAGVAGPCQPLPGADPIDLMMAREGWSSSWSLDRAVGIRGGPLLCQCEMAISNTKSLRFEMGCCLAILMRLCVSNPSYLDEEYLLPGTEATHSLHCPIFCPRGRAHGSRSGTYAIHQNHGSWVALGPACTSKSSSHHYARTLLTRCPSPAGAPAVEPVSCNCLCPSPVGELNAKEGALAELSKPGGSGGASMAGAAGNPLPRRTVTVKMERG